MSNISRAAYTREATEFEKTWPSTVAAVATVADMVPLLSSSVQVTNDQRSIVERGNTGPTAPKITRSRVDGPFGVLGSYEGLEFLLTAALGLEANRIGGVLMPEELVAGTVYRHLIEIDDRLDAIAWQAGEGFVAGPSPTGDELIAGQQKVRRGTYSEVKGVTVWDARSTMVDSLAFQAAPQGVTFQVSPLGHDIDYISGINTALESLVCQPNQILFQDGEFAIRLASSVNFTGPSLIAPLKEYNGIRFTLANGLSAISTRETGKNIDEPRRRLTLVLTGSFSLPRLDSLALIEANQAGLELTARLRFTGDVIGATVENFTFTLWFPSLYLTGTDTTTSGPAQDTQNFSFVGAAPETMPADFPSSVVPGMMLIEIINTIADHPLF